jgi:hypothetical protein
MTPAEAKEKTGLAEPSTYDLTFGWLAIYHAPNVGTAYQENLALIRPSPKLAFVTEHIRRIFEEIGEVTLTTRPDIFPPIYQVQEPDGNCWHFALPILLDEPPRPYEDSYEFVLPDAHP